jgi:hypothetical protein
MRPHETRRLSPDGAAGQAAPAAVCILYMSCHVGVRCESLEDFKYTSCRQAVSSRCCDFTGAGCSHWAGRLLGCQCISQQAAWRDRKQRPFKPKSWQDDSIAQFGSRSHDCNSFIDPAQGFKQISVSTHGPLILLALYATIAFIR